MHAAHPCLPSRVRQRAKLEVLLGKAAQFDQIIAEERAQQAALRSADKAQPPPQPTRMRRSEASASRADTAPSWRMLGRPEEEPLEDGDIGPLAESAEGMLEAGEPGEGSREARDTEEGSAAQQFLGDGSSRGQPRPRQHPPPPAP